MHGPDGSEIPGAEEARLRIQVATALFSIALDHHVAVTVLLQYGMRGSAFALLRAIFDAVWRGAWAGWLASKENLDSFAVDRYDPTPHKAIKALEERLALPPLLSRVLDKGWHSMSAYTHGGALHVQRWVGDGVIEPCHSDEEVIEVLDIADRLAFAACWFFLGIAGMEQDVLNPVGAQFSAAPGP
jgi:hypothetical protein